MRGGEGEAFLTGTGVCGIMCQRKKKHTKNLNFYFSLKTDKEK